MKDTFTIVKFLKIATKCRVYRNRIKELERKLKEYENKK